MPWRREILESLLGADLVGFHTYSYMQHFATALADLAGLEPEDGRVWLDDREVRFGVFPMGIDAETFRQLELATTPASVIAAGSYPKPRFYLISTPAYLIIKYSSHLPALSAK